MCKNDPIQSTIFAITAMPVTAHASEEKFQKGMSSHNHSKSMGVKINPKGMTPIYK